jgi:large subunit ribosomal protein L6
MSRLAKKPTSIPQGVEVTFSEGTLSVKGLKGALSITMDPRIVVEIKDNEAHFIVKKEEIESLALWGTYAAHLRNMIEGVTTGFAKKLEVEGVGFKWEVKDSKIVMALGFSHPVIVPIPEGLQVVTEKLTMTISGLNKDKVGQFAAIVRDYKKPEPYKGKGIHYAGEYIRRKQGKKTV